jgi:predicted ATP-grasp superfamily ATP-dependent carboligase
MPAGPGKVLLTDGEFKHTLGIARALKARGHEVHLVARSGRAPAAHSRAVARTHYLPPTSDPTYPIALLETVIAQQPLSVVAVGDGAVRGADAVRGRWPKGAPIALPPRESLAVANDKARTGELARSLGVDTPRETATESLEEAHAAFAALGGRAVFKSRFEAGRKILRYVKKESQVAAAYEHVKKLSGAGPLVQEHVAGDGWAYFALYWNGVKQRRFMHRRVREWPPSGGTSAAAESVLEAPALERAGEALLDALKWHGVAMVEGKRAADGRFVLMEINAKFWGSHDLALAAGVDFPGDLVALLEGNELAPQEPYRKVRCSWPLGGDLWHGLARPLALPRVLWDGVSPNVAHTFRWTDPVPSFFEVLQWVRSTPNALREARDLR